MCNNNGCTWIIILLCLFLCCGNGCNGLGNNNDNGCGCGC